MAAALAQAIWSGLGRVKVLLQLKLALLASKKAAHLH